MTLTVVHVVGEADTGITRAGQGREVPDRNARVAAWCDALLQATRDDSAAARTILCHGWVDSDLGAEFASTPLASLIGFLGRRDPTGEIRLILITTAPTTDGVPTAGIGHALATTLRGVPDAFGARVSAVDLVDVEGFTDDHVVGRLAKTLGSGPAGDAVMSWGAGATGLALAAVAGLVESGRRWELRSTTSPEQVVFLVPPSRTGSLVPWLFRLGYPGEIVRLAGNGELTPAPDRDTVEHARALQARLDRTAANAGDLADLTEWVRSDLRRLDGTAGLAVRAWLRHRYREHLDTHRTGEVGTLPDLLEFAKTDLLGPNENPTLGLLLSKLKKHQTLDGLPTVLRASFDSPSGKWLLGEKVREVNRAARSSAHEFEPLPASTIKILRRWLPPEDDRPPSVPTFDLPKRAVAMLWAVGHNETPFAATVLDRAVDATVLRHVGVTTSQQIGLSCLIMGTAGDRGTLDAARDEAVSLRAAGAGSQRYATVEASVLESAGRLDTTTAEDLFARALESQTTAPDVLVVVPVGSKILAVGALLAALRYAETHAVPVLLECTDRSPAAVPTYHRIVPALAADHILVGLAHRALGRLELHTASRLLAIGSPDVRSTGLQVDELIAGFRTSPAKGAAWLSICAKRLGDRNLDGPDRVRLVHIAAEFMEPSTALRRIRSDLLINHGKATNQTVEQAVGRAAPKPAPGQRPKTAGVLVREALRRMSSKVGHDAEMAARLTTLYSSIRADLQARRLRLAAIDRGGSEGGPASRRLDKPLPET